ncbi:MAG: DsbA family protein [Burkholderiaceae bacterium]|nr:DsbA family protein [Burkholderiaceae bacterium]
MNQTLPVVKMYSDFKSPYAALAFEPGLDLPEKYNVTVAWRPFQVRQRGAGERSTYSEYKYQYSFIDVRRWGRPRGMQFEPPIRIYDSAPALIGGLFAAKHGVLREYGCEVFRRFFIRDFEIDQADAVAGKLAELGLSADAFRDYLAGAGVADLEAARLESMGDKVFGAPFFTFDGEHFWGYDRMPLLERRMREKGYAKDAPGVIIPPKPIIRPDGTVYVRPVATA